MSARTNFSAKVYQDGALSHKVKRLMAMAVAIQAKCTACIIGQAKQALEQGATKEEVLEAVAVATSMGGSTSYASAYRVAKVLEELGKL